MKKFLYKYRTIDNKGALDDALSLKALFEHKAVFSSRKSFNDLFDSKINFKSIADRDIERVIELGYKLSFTSKNEQRREIETMFIQNFKVLLDSYVFYCVSANPTSNLMWSHYADSHKGSSSEKKSCMQKK